MDGFIQLVVLLAAVGLGILMFAAILKLFTIAKCMQQVVTLLQIQTHTNTSELEALDRRKHGKSSADELNTSVLNIR